jgi:hypothetical protein
VVGRIIPEIIKRKKLVSKGLGFVRGQGVKRISKRSVLQVREHLESVSNAAPGQKMSLLKSILEGARVPELCPHPPGRNSHHHRQHRTDLFIGQSFFLGDAKV